MEIPLTVLARNMYVDRRTQAKWVKCKRYLRDRGISIYQNLPMALRIVRRMH